MKNSIVSSFELPKEKRSYIDRELSKEQEKLDNRYH